METISLSITAGQSLTDYSETLRVDRFKLRISIRSDAYAFQSFARLEVFSPSEMKWNELVSINYGAMETPAKLYHRPNQEGLLPVLYADDRDEMLRQAADILDFEMTPSPSISRPRR